MSSAFNEIMNSPHPSTPTPMGVAHRIHIENRAFVVPYLFKSITRLRISNNPSCLIRVNQILLIIFIEKPCIVDRKRWTDNFWCRLSASIIAE